MDFRRVCCSPTFAASLYRKHNKVLKNVLITHLGDRGKCADQPYICIKGVGRRGAYKYRRTCYTSRENRPRKSPPAGNPNMPPVRVAFAANYFVGIFSRFLAFFGWFVPLICLAAGE